MGYLSRLPFISISLHPFHLVAPGNQPPPGGGLRWLFFGCGAVGGYFGARLAELLGGCWAAVCVGRSGRSYVSGVNPKIRGFYPQNGWFIMVNPIEIHDMGGNNTIFGNTH